MEENLIQNGIEERFWFKPGVINNLICYQCLSSLGIFSILMQQQLLTYHNSIICFVNSWIFLFKISIIKKLTSRRHFRRDPNNYRFFHKLNILIEAIGITILIIYHGLKLQHPILFNLVLFVIIENEIYFILNCIYSIGWCLLSPCRTRYLRKKNLINTLKKKKLLASITLTDLDYQDQCLICLSEFDNESKISRLPCKHYYHTQCITSWLSDHDTCPQCRIDLTQTPDQLINQI